MLGHLAELIAGERSLNAVAAGITDQNGVAVDMTDADGVLFIALFGTLTATQVTLIKAQQGALSDGSDAVDITGAATLALADGDSNKALILDVLRPSQRYVRCVVDRGTANAVIDGVFAFKYRIKKQGQVGPSLHATVKEAKKLQVAI